MNSIGRCDPVPFDSGEPDDGTSPACWFRFPIGERPHETQAFFDICMPSEGGILSLSESDVYRLLCHALIHHLPDRAFSEAYEALTGMHEFYQFSPALPATPSHHSVKAKITESYTAPVYPITED